MQCKFGRVTFENVLKVAEGSTLSALAPAFAIALRTTNVAITNKAVEVCPLSLTLSLALSFSRTLPFSLELTHTLSHSCSLSNSLFLFPVYQRRHHQQGCRGVSSHSSLSHTLSPTHTRSLSGPVTSPSPTRPSRCVLSLSLTHTNTLTHTQTLTLSHTLSLSLRTSNVAITNQAVEFPLPSPKPYQCQQGLNPNPETRANAD